MLTACPCFYFDTYRESHHLSVKYARTSIKFFQGISLPLHLSHN
jgi:hypothetical protein